MLEIILYIILGLFILAAIGVVVSSWRISYRTPDPVDYENEDYEE